MADKTLHTSFSEALHSHGYGHAFYEPESASVVRPGACGYLRNGSWVPIVDLTNAQDLAAHGLTACPPLQQAPESDREWGPKISSNIRQKKIDFKANASLVPAGIPANISSLYEYEASDEHGAMLMTKPPVIKQALYRDEPIKQWVKQNAMKIKEEWPEVATNGLFIATSTFSTTEACTNMLKTKGQKVTIGFSANVVGIGEIAPSANWHTAATDGGWVRSKATGESPRKVVFVGGIYFRWPRLLFGDAVREVPQYQWSRHLRGDSAQTLHISPPSDDFPEGQSLELEFFGHYEHRLEKDVMAVEPDDEF